MRLYGVLIASCLASIAFTNSVYAADAAENAGLAQALAQLRSSDAEWRREEATYRAIRLAGKMTTAEAEEYAGFVASLHRRKLEDCDSVRKIAGNDPLKGFNCAVPIGPQSASISLPSGPASAKTEGEKIEALEDRLNRLEAEVDQELLRKQQAYRRSERNAGQAGGGPSGSSSGYGSGAGGANGGGSGRDGQGTQSGNRAGRDGKNGSASAGRGASRAGDAGTDGGERSDQQGGLPGMPRTGPHQPGAGPGFQKDAKGAPESKDRSEDGSDDSVVMRQIRDAAERETDPVLKEKLWAEYRKLKEAR